MGKKTPGRRRARRTAIQFLYSLSYSPVENMESLEQAFNRFLPNFSKDNEPGDGADENSHKFAWELIAGVWVNKPVLDEAIEHFSRNWRIGRMGKIELMILRVALLEIFSCMTPAKAAINEALELGAQYGEDNAKKFINGVLDAAARACQSQAYPIALKQAQIR